MVIAGAGPAAAEGTPEGVPAVMLLIPHFEVELDNPNGVQILVTVRNAAAGATLARLSLWTDLAIPALHRQDQQEQAPGPNGRMP